MNNRITIALIALILMAAACEKEPLQPNNPNTEQELKYKRGNNNGKGSKKDQEQEEDEVSDTVRYISTFIAYDVDDADPLYKFKLNTTGDTMLLRTDPSVTSWGDDYWGAWADPFEFKDGKVIFKSTLSTTTYEFTLQSDGSYDVNRTSIVARSYFPNSGVDTFITHPGIYIQE